MATGYNVDGSAAPLIDLGWISPAGQMFSSARDLGMVSLHVSYACIDPEYAYYICMSLCYSVCKVLYE